MVGEMLAMKSMPVVHQDSPARENDLTAATIIDMSSPMRTPPSGVVGLVAQQEQQQLRNCNGQQTIITQEIINSKHSEQWMMTNGHVTNAGAIHRKSFNIDALLAKSQTGGGGGDQKEQFVHSPDSANDCYAEDRRDFTPSPEGNNFR